MTPVYTTPFERAVTHKWAFWLVLLVALIADIASKGWADTHVRPLGSAVAPVIDGVLAWKWAENQGAAFSLLRERPELLSLIAVGVLAFVILFAFRAERKRGWYLAALGLVAAGAIGNLYDRLLLGFVRDFMFFDFDLPWSGYSIFGHQFKAVERWPVFNVADVAILGGVGILLLQTFFAPAQKKPKDAESGEDELAAEPQG